MKGLRKPPATTFALTILFLFALAFVAMLVLGMFSMIFFVGFAIVGTALFVVFNLTRTKRIDTQELAQVSGTFPARTVSKSLSILFFSFFGLSLLVITPGSGLKPLCYYLLISFCAATIASDILVARMKSDIILNLAKSYILGLNIFLVNQIIFPYGIGGADSSAHLGAIINPLVSHGHIPATDFIYAAFPVHHISVAMGSHVLSISPNLAYYVLGSIFLSFGIFFAFLIGRLLFDQKFGLLAALVFSGSSYIIFWASHSAQVTYVAPIILALVLAVLYLYREGHVGYKLLIPIMVVFVIFSHPYSSVLAMVILLSILLTEKLLRLQKSYSGWSVWNLLLIFLAILLAHWIYYSFIFETAVGYVESYVDTIMGESLIAPRAVYDSYPLSVIFLNTFGLSLMGMLSVCGFFHFYARLSLSRAIVIGLAVALAAIAFVGLVFDFIYIIPHRIFFYLEGLAFVFFFPGAVRYLRLDSFKRGLSSLRPLLFAALVALVFFFSASSTVSGFETSLFATDDPYVKLYETGYERRSVDWIDRHFEEFEGHTIYVSWSLSLHSINSLHGTAENDALTLEYLPLALDHDDVDFDSIEHNSTILFSTFDISIGFQSGVTGGGRYGLGLYGRFDDMDLHNFRVFDRHFDDGKVIVFHNHDR